MEVYSTENSKSDLCVGTIITKTSNFLRIFKLDSFRLHSPQIVEFGILEPVDRLDRLLRPLGEV